MSVLVRVGVKVRVSFRLATFMYSVWPPVSVKVRVSLGIGLGFRVRVSLGIGLGLELRSGSVLNSPLLCILYVLLYPIFLTPNPKNFSVPFNLPPNLYYV